MVRDFRTRLGAWTTVAGALVAAISCTVMIAATIIGLLGVIGIRASAAFADTFNTLLLPIAQPLLIGSLALIVIGLVPRGRVPVAMTLVGSVMVYLSMFVLGTSSSGGSQTNGMGAMDAMAGMSTTTADPLSLVAFWLGLGGIAISFFIAYRS